MRYADISLAFNHKVAILVCPQQYSESMDFHVGIRLDAALRKQGFNTQLIHGEVDRRALQRAISDRALHDTRVALVAFFADSYSDGAKFQSAQLVHMMRDAGLCGQLVICVSNACITHDMDMDITTVAHDSRESIEDIVKRIQKNVCITSFSAGHAQRG